MQAIIQLKDQAGLGLAEAKSVAFHISDEGGQCHRCHHELLGEEEEVDCPKCLSLNLKW
jgi:Zn finger protein HypA/HybF involved in hydrogenase expression